MEIELKWKGYLKINIETPSGEEGKHGLYAFLYDSDLIYWGMAAGKNHLFQESKFRYKILERAFLKRRVIEGPVYNSKLDMIAETHCRKYVGELLDEKKLDYLKDAENLLIFKHPTDGNVKLTKRYRGVIPLLVINSGPGAIELGLKNYKIISEDARTDREKLLVLEI